MKVCSIIVLLFMLLTFSQSRHKLVGKYKFVPKYGNVYFMDINDSIYTIFFSNGETNRGVVEYGDKYIYLRDYEKELRIIDSRPAYIESNKLKERNLIALEVGKKKTMNYCRHIYSEDGPSNWLDVCVESGKITRIK